MKSKKSCYAAKGLPKVPGKPKGTDIVPAWLTPGEAILSPAAAEMLGRGNVQALNQAASTMRLGKPQYKAEGGMLDDQQAEAQRIVGSPDQYDPATVQAAQDYLNQMQTRQEPQYFMGGTASVPRLGTVQPGYYAVGTSYAGMGSQNMLEDALRNQGMGRAISDSKALVPAGPRTSMPTGMLGEGQGIKVMQNGLGTGPVRIPSSALPQAPTAPVDPMAAKMGQYSAPPSRLTDPIAQKMASAAYKPPVATPPASGLARLGQGITQNFNTIPSVARTAGDIAGVMRSDANPVIKGLATAESVGNAAFGALTDRLGNGKLAGAGMVPMMASGYRPITAGLNAMGVQTPLSYVQNPAQQSGFDPRRPDTPMSPEQTQRFLDNPNRNTNILDSRGVSAAPRVSQPGSLPMSGGVPYLDQVSADRASQARALDPGYVKTATGLMASGPTSPNKLARQNAMWAQMDKMNAAQQPRIGTAPMTRQVQPLPQMQQPRALGTNAMPAGWTQGDMERKDFLDGLGAYNSSAQRLVDMEDTNMRKYWSTVQQLQNSLDWAQDPEKARSYATALSGLNVPNLGGASASASMYGADAGRDASRFNSGLDYNAKMSEIGAGQGLREAQMQEAMARAGNLTSDANLQNAMAANPERFAGMRLGSRGAVGGNGLKLEKYSAGMEGGDKFALFNPEDQSLTEIQPQLKPTPAEQKKLSQLKAAYPDADEESLINYIRSMFNAK